MSVPATYLTPEAGAALLAESRRRAEAARNRRALRERIAQFEQHLSEPQKHERALFEARMRANRLRRLPTVFGELT